MNCLLKKMGLTGIAALFFLLALGKTMLCAQSFPSMPPQQYPPTPSSPGPPAYTPIPPGTLPSPAAPTREIEKGVVNPRTGEFYPGTHGGVLDPKTGVVLPKVEGGYQNPQTGEIIPKSQTHP
jgi:hypothetical protein